MGFGIQLPACIMAKVDGAWGARVDLSAEVKGSGSISSAWSVSSISDPKRSSLSLSAEAAMDEFTRGKPASRTMQRMKLSGGRRRA